MDIFTFNGEWGFYTLFFVKVKPFTRHAKAALKTNK